MQPETPTPAVSRARLTLALVAAAAMPILTGLLTVRAQGASSQAGASPAGTVAP